MTARRAAAGGSVQPSSPPAVSQLANAHSLAGETVADAARLGDDTTGQQHDAAEMFSVSARRSDQREGLTLRATRWCTGDMEAHDGSMAVRRAAAIGQMPHGRWQTYVEAGGATGIAQSGVEPWAAQLVHRDNGLHLGVTTFRPTAMVFDGTSEELAQRLVSVLEGTRTTRLLTNRGVVSHLVRNNRRPDIHTMLAAVGVNVTNTNPSAASPMQSPLRRATPLPRRHATETNVMRCLVQLRGTKELLMHPHAPSLPGCLAHIDEGTAESRASRWLWDFDPFQLAVCHTSSWVKVVLVPGRAVAVPRGRWHAVRSTPKSVAISVAVQVEQIDERTSLRRACRRDVQPEAESRKAQQVCLGGGGSSNSRRTDITIGECAPATHCLESLDSQLGFGGWIGLSLPARAGYDASGRHSRLGREGASLQPPNPKPRWSPAGRAQSLSQGQRGGGARPSRRAQADQRSERRASPAAGARATSATRRP